jgi:SAD/SRA domain
VTSPDVISLEVTSPATSSPTLLTWHEVLRVHASRRGIRVTEAQATLLLDFGLSLYVNRREGDRIYYEGEGKRGDQTPTRGNAGLLHCLETKRPVRVFERLRPGAWQDQGEYRVVAAIYRAAPEENRMIFEFTLERV